MLYKLLVTTCLLLANGGSAFTPVRPSLTSQVSTGKQELIRHARQGVGLPRGGALNAITVPGWGAYTKALEEKPLTSKALTSLVGWALGDILAQVFIETSPFNYIRLLRLSAFGVLYHGPSGHYFYNWLDKKVPGTGFKQVMSKVAFDQIVWCPIFMSVFFTYLGLVNGDGLAAIGSKISTDLLGACKGSWKVWPVVHAVNFRFVPNKFRLFYINTVQIAFNIFLSIIGTK